MDHQKKSGSHLGVESTTLILLRRSLLVVGMENPIEKGFPYLTNISIILPVPTGAFRTTRLSNDSLYSYLTEGNYVEDGNWTLMVMW